MEKEIHDQPEGCQRTIAAYLDPVAGRTAMPGEIDFAALERIQIVACGTSFYAGMVAKYWFEQFARLPVDIDVASEFRYRDPVLEPGGLALFISQSGETADVIESMLAARTRGTRLGALVNVPRSTLDRLVDVRVPLRAGPEQCVLSTKAYTA